MGDHEHDGELIVRLMSLFLFACAAQEYSPTGRYAAAQFHPTGRYAAQQKEDLSKYPQWFQKDKYGRLYMTTDKHLIEDHKATSDQLNGLSPEDKNRLHGKFHKELEDATPKPRFPRILFFTASYCGPCQAAKGECFEWLKHSGWQIDESDRAHLQVVPIEKNSGLFAKYGVGAMPSFVLIDSNGVIARSGYEGRKTFENLLGKLK